MKSKKEIFRPNTEECLNEKSSMVDFDIVRILQTAEGQFRLRDCFAQHGMTTIQKSLAIGLRCSI